MGFTLSLSEEQEEAVRRILSSTHGKRLIVAGPGAGKTTVFRTALERLPPSPSSARLALTFIRALQQDLQGSLGTLAQTSTLHAFCHSLLRDRPELRAPLSPDFLYFPKLAHIVHGDWQIANGDLAPPIATGLRNCDRDAGTSFFLARSEYYDAIGFDDSVFRVSTQLHASPELTPSYDLVIVDEFQDFNLAEARLIWQLGKKSPLLIAGDDDQALYGQLRGAQERLIRDLYASNQVATFQLPFCMRCPSAIVDAANDIIANATQSGMLRGRISKAYRAFPPAKAEDSKKYPTITVVKTSVQNARANYFGRYIQEVIAGIPQEEVARSHEKGHPTALVIGARPFLPEVEAFLRESGHQVISPPASASPIDELAREEGLALLKCNPSSNLGWRVMLELDHEDRLRAFVSRSLKGRPLCELLSAKYKAQVLREASAYEAEEFDLPVEHQTRDKARATVRIASFEGSKGLSADHVFVIGLHNGGLPRNPLEIRDQEIRKFLVAITRSRRSCHLIHSSRSRDGSTQLRRSSFIDWIRKSRVSHSSVNKSSLAKGSNT